MMDIEDLLVIGVITAVSVSALAGILAITDIPREGLVEERKESHRILQSSCVDSGGIYLDLHGGYKCFQKDYIDKVLVIEENL